MASKPKLIIVGAGFGGIKLSKELNNSAYEVTLIDKHNYHTFQPLLYQVATGGLEPSNIAYPVRRIFRKSPNFKFVMTEVISVDTENKQLITKLGDMPYDKLVIATGSTTNFFNFSDRADIFFSLKSVTEALDIRNTIMRNLEGYNYASEIEKEEIMNISVIGAGPAGVEIAGTIAEMKRKVLPKDFPEYDFSKMNIYLFEAADRVLAGMSASSSEHALEYLEELGVKVMLNTMVSDYDEHEIQFGENEKLRSKTVIWTAGVKANPLGGLRPDSLAQGSRIKVDEYNRVIGEKDIYAIGDVAVHSTDNHPKGQPMLAQVAIQQAVILAKNLKAELGGNTLKPFFYNNKGIMATVGRNKAVVELPKLKFKGVFAWLVWMFVHLMALVGFRNKLITFIDWLQNYINYDRPLGAVIRKYHKE